MLLFNKMKIQDNSGQTLVEVSIALSAVLLTLAAIAILIVISVSNSVYIKNQSQAAKYAQEGMEQVRYLKNNNIPLFSSYDGSWCMGDGNSLTISSGACSVVNVNSQYIRQVDFEKNSLDVNCSQQTKVIVTVRWQSTKCIGSDTNARYCHKSVLISCFRDPSGQSANL
jgi:type II secretory pathway pseudopilin PulG